MFVSKHREENSNCEYKQNFGIFRKWSLVINMKKIQYPRICEEITVLRLDNTETILIKKVKK